MEGKIIEEGEAGTARQAGSNGVLHKRHEVEWKKRIRSKGKTKVTYVWAAATSIQQETPESEGGSQHSRRVMNPKEPEGRRCNVTLARDSTLNCAITKTLVDGAGHGLATEKRGVRKPTEAESLVTSLIRVNR